MTATALPFASTRSSFARPLVRAGVATALVDGTFATVFNSVLRHDISLTRVWRGVAATIAGQGALDGGLSYVALGIAMHFVVAFTWSAILVLLLGRSLTLRRILWSPWGALKVGVVYGPLIWTTMSWCVVPMLTHKFPTITVPWMAMWVGHMFFVGLPMAAAIRRE